MTNSSKPKTPDLESTALTIQEFEACFGLSTRTILQMIRQLDLRTITVNGVLKIPDPGWGRDPKMGTGGVEDIYCLRGCEVAELLGVSPRRVRQFVERGYLECIFQGRNRRYSVTHVRRLLAARQQIGPHWFKRVKHSMIRQGVVAWAKQRLSNLEKLKETTPPDQNVIDI